MLILWICQLPIDRTNIYYIYPFQYIEGKIPAYNSTAKVESIVLTVTNSISKDIIYTNSSLELANLNKNDTNEESSEIVYDHWPIWLQQVTCISHLMLAFNSSVNFFIYYMKRKTLSTGMKLLSRIIVYGHWTYRYFSLLFPHHIVGQPMTVSNLDETIRMGTTIKNEE